MPLELFVQPFDLGSYVSQARLRDHCLRPGKEADLIPPLEHFQTPQILALLAAHLPERTFTTALAGLAQAFYLKTGSPADILLGEVEALNKQKPGL